MIRCHSLAVILLFLASALLAIVPADAFARKWSDGRGHQTEAKYVRVFNGNVILMRGGRVLSVPLAKLSDADRRYVEAKAAGKSDHEAEQAAEGAGLEQENAAANGIDAPRIWTDSKGNQVLATFVRIAGANLILSQNGKETPYPFVNFSTEDRKFVREQFEDRGEGHLVPAEEPKPSPATRRPSARPSFTRSRISPGGGRSRHSFPSMAFRTPKIPEIKIPKVPEMRRPKMPKFERPKMPEMQPIETTQATPNVHEFQSMKEPEIERTASFPSHPRMPRMTIPEPKMPELPSNFQGPSGGTSGNSVCGGCNRAVPDNLGAGDKCPYCGVFFEYEEFEDGTYRDKQGRKVSSFWVKVGGGGGLFALVIAVLFGILRVARFAGR